MRGIRPAFAAFACVVLAGCTSTTHTIRTTDTISQSGPHQSTTNGTSRVRLGDIAQAQIPVTWQRVGYHGEIATVVNPVLFLTSGRLHGRCLHGPSRAACTSRDWFAPGWRVPADGVLIDWLDLEFPTPAQPSGRFLGVSGRRLIIDGRPARLGPNSTVDACPSGATTELDFTVQQSKTQEPGRRLSMVACFGPHASARVRTQVMNMIRSLRFAPPR